jgi:HD-like signal output (HDOD) protein
MGFREEILKRLQKVTDLPTLPAMHLEVMRLMQDERSSASGVAELLSNDPSMAAKVLRVANSVAYGSHERVSSVSQAVTRMGFRQTSEIVLTLTVLDLFKDSALIDYAKFWQHSVCVATATRILVKYLSRWPREPAHTHTAGLLHDIGILALIRYGGDLYHSVISTAQDRHAALHEVEIEIMGVDHGEVGAIVLGRWRLPQSVVDACTVHHAPPNRGTSPTIPTAEMVHMANVCCESQGVTNGIDTHTEAMDDAQWGEYGFKAVDIPAIMQAVREEAKRALIIIDAAKPEPA